MEEWEASPAEAHWPPEEDDTWGQWTPQPEETTLSHWEDPLEMQEDASDDDWGPWSSSGHAPVKEEDNISTGGIENDWDNPFEPEDEDWDPYQAEAVESHDGLEVKEEEEAWESEENWGNWDTVTSPNPDFDTEQGDPTPSPDSTPEVEAPDTEATSTFLRTGGDNDEAWLEVLRLGLARECPPPRHLRSSSVTTSSTTLRKLRPPCLPPRP